MRNYQLVLVLKSSLSDAQRKKLVDLIKSWLKGVKITKEEEWGKKPLAYQIRHEASGYYLNVLFETKEALPTDFGKRVLANDEILRHLLLRQ